MNVTIGLIATVYLAFAAKHLVCDYGLQTSWMVMGKSAAIGWEKPLAAHAAIHALGTLLIVLVLAPSLWWLAPLDFVLHGAIDRTKSVASRNWNMGQQRFWVAFGADQMAHQLTHFAYVLLVLQRISAG